MSALSEMYSPDLNTLTTSKKLTNFANREFGITDIEDHDRSSILTVILLGEFFQERFAERDSIDAYRCIGTPESDQALQEIFQGEDLAYAA